MSFTVKYHHKWILKFFVKTLQFLLSKIFSLFEQRHKKTCLWGFRPGPTQTGCTVTGDG